MLELNSTDGKPFRCVITNSGNITLLIDGKVYAVDKEFPFYEDVRKGIEKRNIKAVKNLLDIEASIKKSFDKAVDENRRDCANLVEVRNGTVFYRGEILHNTITARILEFKRQGLPFEPLLKFLENLMQNPSKRAVDELYGFMEATGIPLTDSGNILCYKSVTCDYLDKYSRTISNKIGTIVEVPRNSVCDDATKVCDFGLHAGGLLYSGPNGWYHNNGDKVVIVEINPKDVVSVPIDHNLQKLRVCKYKVLRDYDGELDKFLYETKLKEDGIVNDGECFFDTRNNHKYQKRDSNGRFIKNS